MDFLGNEIDHLLMPLVEANMLSGSILIADDQAILYARSFGFADRENGLENNSATVFRLGSVTKALTSLAIFKLIEKQTITLNDPVANFIPGICKPLHSTTLLRTLSQASAMAIKSPFFIY
jgi:CubicO group peptidase (beta-lactamase class C family)